MEENLKLRNEEAISSVEGIIDEAKKLFPRDMNWNKSPYTIIFYKKHNQIIVRFQFIKPQVTWNFEDKINNLKNSWVEYSKRKDKLYLVSILENCV